MDCCSLATYIMERQLTCRPFSSFRELPEVYRQAFNSNENLPFDQSLDWLEAYAEHVGASAQLMLVGVEDLRDGTPFGVLPLDINLGGKSPFKKRTVAALANYYTTHFDIVFLDKFDPQLVAELAGFLKRLTPGWAYLDLNPMPAESGGFEGLFEAFSSDGYRSERYVRFANWKVNVAGQDYDAYMSRRPTKLVQTIKRRTRKLEKSGEAEVVIVTDPSSVGEAMDDYEKIYASSWKEPEPYPQFIRDVAERFAQRGWLRLGLVRLDGVPVAAQIWFVKGGIASIFKLAYDPAYSKLSPGSVLSAALTRHVLEEDHVTEIDFLSGDDSYKQDWMEVRAEMMGLRAYRLKSLAALPGAIKSVLKQVVKGNG